MWLIGAVMCLLAAPWVQLSVSAGNGWPHNALRHHWLMPINCHFRDCKALLVTSLTHVSGAIASVQTFTFTFTFTAVRPCTSCNKIIRHPHHRCCHGRILAVKSWVYDVLEVLGLLDSTEKRIITTQVYFDR